MDDRVSAFAMAVQAQSLFEKRPTELFDKDNIKVEMEAKTKPAYKTLKEMYSEWLTPSVEHIKKTLVDYYGAEQEFTITKRTSFGKWLEDNDKGSTASNNTFFKRCLRGVETVGNEWRRTTAYTIIVHLPELTVRNSSRSTHKIHDFFIKAELSPFLSDIHGYQFFRGMRTSYSLAELTSDYNFSHLQGGATNFSYNNFCLGHTDFSTMCRSLAIEFNNNFFSLWCQQLPDYLSWESIEGGPYKRFANVTERGHYNTVTISTADKQSYYRQYLAAGHIPNTEVRSNPFYYTVSVVEDDDLRKAITKVVTNDSHLQFWDNERKVATDRSISNRQSTIDSYIRNHGSQVILKFNGNDVKLRVTDNLPMKDEKSDKTMVAHNSIMSYIVGSLNKGMLKNLKDEFNKKRRRYTAG